MLSNLATVNDIGDRQWLRRKMTPAMFLMVITLVPGTLFAFVVIGFHAGQWISAILIPGLLFCGLLFNYFSDRGYQLGSDSERIYVRDWGYTGLFRRRPIHSMKYGEIASMEEIIKGDAGPRSSFQFDALELISSGLEGDNIIIDPASFPNADMKNFLHELHARRSDIFTDAALEYMNSNRKY